jgi:DNA-binding winged helix-turn-helix (wHTH) protein/tetratricopeptide (TPR) repeat protein
MATGARDALPGLRLVRDEADRIVLAHEQPFHIGSAEFRPATREVVCRGETSIVEPRVMQLLVALHRAERGVVSKDDLASLCWEGRIVGEDAINRVVSRLRAVGEKQAGGQFRIETITKVGYRLIPADGAIPSPETRSPHAPAAKPALGRRRFLIAGGAVGAVALGGIGWKALHRDTMPADARALLDGARGSLCGVNVDQAGNALAHVRKAVELAPNSAEAWGLLGLAYMRYVHAAPADQRSDLHSRGLMAIRRAIALEPNQADALAAQLWSSPLYRNWYNYETAARAALRLHPDSLILELSLALCLADVGRTQEALPALEKTLATYPEISENYVSYAFGLWDAGRLDDAEAIISKAFELFPRNINVWFTRVYYLLYNHRASEAAGQLADLAGRPAGVPDWDYDLTQLELEAIANGDSARIRKCIEAWDKAAEKGTGFTINGAIFAAYVGDFDECFRLLNALYFNRGIRMADTYFTKEQGIYVGADRRTYDLFRRPNAPMRRDPRFGQLTRELGLDDYWARTHSRSLVNP